MRKRVRNHFVHTSQPNEIEGIIDQLISGKANEKMLKLLQEKDIVLSKQEKEIHQSRQRIAALLSQFRVVKSNGTRDVRLLNCKENTIKSKVANALGDYLAEKKSSVFNRNDFYNWCEKTELKVNRLQIIQMLSHWTREGLIIPSIGHGNKTFICTGLLADFVLGE